MARIMESLNSPLCGVLVQVSSCLAVLIVWIHTSGCVWYWIGIDGWVKFYDSASSPLALKYLMSVGLSITTIQGESGIENGYSIPERAYGLGVQLVSIVLTAVFGSELTTAFVSAAARRREKGAQMELTVSYMSKNGISHQLCMQIKQYFKTKAHAEQNCVALEQNVLAGLPVRLQRNLLQEARASALTAHCVFVSWASTRVRSFQQLCCEKIRVCDYVGETTIFSYGEQCAHMLVLQSGCCTYVNYGAPLPSVRGFGGGVRKVSFESMVRSIALEKGVQRATEVSIDGGTMLCELALWTRWLYCGELETTSYTTSLELAIADFFEFLKRYPALFNWGCHHAQRMVDVLNTLPHMSDLYDTVYCLDYEHREDCYKHGSRNSKRMSAAGRRSRTSFAYEA